MKRFLSFAILLGLCVAAAAQSRQITNFDAGWRFRLGDQSGAQAAGFNDRSWRSLSLPHDWSIELDPVESAPGGGAVGYFPTGIGWYRKTFDVPGYSKDKLYSVEFDGVYMNSTVWINGTEVGSWPYGYSSFSYDITPVLKASGNVIAVRVDNSVQPNSRWYSGSGIYRHVRLVATSQTHFEKWGVFNYTQDISGGKAVIKIQSSVINKLKSRLNGTVRHILLDADGRQVADTSVVVEILAGTKHPVVQTLVVDNPTLWDLDNPYLYTLRSVILDGSKELDRVDDVLGIRTINYDVDQGFFLNGKHVKMYGVKVHHDGGSEGAAVPARVWERRLEIFKSGGCNAIRTAHNPPDPTFLDACDRVGMLVMDEAFDQWVAPKNPYDYNLYFNEWHEHDLHDFVLRDRNHPSVVIWSIGNEVLEQWTDASADTLSLEQANLLLNFGHSADQLAKDDGTMSVNSLLTRKLVDYVKARDNRPITSGCNEPHADTPLFKSGALDVIGFNYHNQNIPDVPSRFPGKPFIITESNSALMTRGYYRMPSDSMYIFPKRWDLPFADESFACSSYENCHVPWGNTNEENLLLMRRYPWICGQFVWTGFDYIGEPTPYGWPARSSYFGIVDLAGFPKDVYYLYKAELTTDTVLHVFPHWTWSLEQLPADGMIDLWAYYNNADEVELYVNGKSQGTRHKTDSCLHTVWRVRYEPGEVIAVSRLRGKEIQRKVIRTAGEPSQIRLSPDRSVIAADGNDLSFVTVEILDEDGNLCPWADNLIEFSVTGPAVIAGVDNGSQTSLESFVEPRRHAFYGKCLVVLRNNGTKGEAELKATIGHLPTCPNGEGTAPQPPKGTAVRIMCK